MMCYPSADDVWLYQHSSSPLLLHSSLTSRRPATLPCHHDSAGSQEECCNKDPIALSPTYSTSSGSDKAHARPPSHACQATTTAQAKLQAHSNHAIENVNTRSSSCMGARGRAGTGGSGASSSSSSSSSRGSGHATPADVLHPMWVAFLQGLLDAHQRHCLLWHFDPTASSSSPTTQVKHCSGAGNSTRAGQLFSSRGSDTQPGWSSWNKASEFRQLPVQQHLVSTVAGTGGAGKRVPPAAAAAQATWPCCWPYN